MSARSGERDAQPLPAAIAAARATLPRRRPAGKRDDTRRPPARTASVENRLP
jgi:hypothetical protein